MQIYDALFLEHWGLGESIAHRPGVADIGFESSDVGLDISLDVGINLDVGLRRGLEPWT